MYNRHVRKQYSDNLRRLQAERFKSAAPPPKEATWQAKLQHLQEQRKHPAAPAPAAPALVQTPPLNGMIPVVFSATWNRLEVGWDIAVRALARAMRVGSVDCRLYPPNVPMSPEVTHEVGHLAHAVTRWDLFIQSSCFARADMIQGTIAHLRRQPGKQVLFTMFERRQFDQRIASLLKPLTAVLVPCSSNRDALRKIGVQNAVWFPVPHFPDDPLLTLPPPKEARVFYWMGNWSPRKAPDNLVRAFLRAFHPDEAELRLKTGPWRFHAGWPEPEDIIAAELGGERVRKMGWTGSNWQGSIKVDRRGMSRSEVVGLVHGQGDVYVSASRGEGYDMPAYEAKLARRRVITTDSGGPRDFLGENDILINETGEIPVHHDYVRLFAWEPYATYIDYDLEDLVKAFQKARGEPVQGDDWPREKFTGLTVGENFRKWLESC